MGDVEFPNWIAKRIGECASRLELGVVERGEPLSVEDDAAGEKEALAFIASRQVPKDGERCARLFPRMWAVRKHLDRSQLNPRLQIWEDMEREDVLQILLVETWPKLGRKRWEAARDTSARW